MKTFYAHPRLPRRTHSAPALPLAFALYENDAQDYKMCNFNREREMCENSLHQTLQSGISNCACANLTEEKQTYYNEINENVAVTPTIVTNTNHETISDELESKEDNVSSLSAECMQLENCEEFTGDTSAPAIANRVKNTQNTWTKINSYKLPKEPAKETIIHTEWQNANTTNVKRAETKESDMKKVLERRELFKQYTFLNKPTTNTNSCIASRCNANYSNAKKSRRGKVRDKFLPTSETNESNARESTMTSTSQCFASAITDESKSNNNNNDVAYTDSHHDKEEECEAERKSSHFNLSNATDVHITNHVVAINNQSDEYNNSKNNNSYLQINKSNLNLLSSSSSSSSLSMELSQQCHRSLDRISCLLLLLHRAFTPPRPLNSLQRNDAFYITSNKVIKANSSNVDLHDTNKYSTTCQHHNNEDHSNAQITVESTQNGEINANDAMSCDSICSADSISSSSGRSEKKKTSSKHATCAAQASPVAKCEHNKEEIVATTKEMQDVNKIATEWSKWLNCTPHSARSRSLQRERNVLGEIEHNILQTPSSLEHTCAHKWRSSCTSVIKNSSDYNLHDDIILEKKDEQECSVHEQHSESLHPVNGIVRFLSPSRRTLFNSYTNNRMYPTFAEHVIEKSMPSYLFSCESSNTFTNKIRVPYTSDLEMLTLSQDDDKKS